MQELLGELRDQYRPRSLCQQLHRLAVLALTWALSLGSVLACVLAVYYFSEHMHRVSMPYHQIPTESPPGAGTPVPGPSTPSSELLAGG